ncbi:hypothetical protein [Arenibacter algicola]|uniref:hypothetical protein n=1 Tax=Arenibacter algicola TaxID=616991 RepID=UPI000BB45472|nr:hypothetical protein [Arenibacter algicola]
MRFCKTNKELVPKTLRNLVINLGNTSDSIVQEITKNLQIIATRKGCGDEVRKPGYTMSLNRIISYPEANIDNLDSWKHVTV